MNLVRSPWNAFGAGTLLAVVFLGVASAVWPRYMPPHAECCTGGEAARRGIHCGCAASDGACTLPCSTCCAPDTCRGVVPRVAPGGRP